MKMQITQKIKKPWSKLGPEIRAALDAKKTTARDLSDVAGINLHAAYRLLAGGLVRSSIPARKICISLGIDEFENANIGNQSLREKIDEQIDMVWDGSEGHAELICRLITSTKALNVTMASK